MIVNDICKNLHTTVIVILIAEKYTKGIHIISILAQCFFILRCFDICLLFSLVILITHCQQNLSSMRIFGKVKCLFS